MKYVKLGSEYASIPELIAIIFIGCLFVYGAFFVCPHMRAKSAEAQETTDSSHHGTNPGINAHHIFHR